MDAGHPMCMMNLMYCRGCLTWHAVLVDMHLQKHGEGAPRHVGMWQLPYHMRCCQQCAFLRVLASQECRSMDL